MWGSTDVSTDTEIKERRYQGEGVMPQINNIQVLGPEPVTLKHFVHWYHLQCASITGRPPSCCSKSSSAQEGLGSGRKEVAVRKEARLWTVVSSRRCLPIAGSDFGIGGNGEEINTLRGQTHQQRTGVTAVRPVDGDDDTDAWQGNGRCKKETERRSIRRRRCHTLNTDVRCDNIILFGSIK
jgi:hypothetical protein